MEKKIIYALGIGFVLNFIINLLVTLPNAVVKTLWYIMKIFLFIAGIFFMFIWVGAKE